MGKHVIVGAGQVGAQVARLLAADGHEVVVVTRSGRGPHAPGITSVAADAGDPAGLKKITKGADALYNCANPKYHRWVQDWPPVAESMLSTAEATGAVLVTLSNLYGYGPVNRPMAEDLPMAATGKKGRVRAEMWRQALAAHEAGRARVTEVRGSDYFGVGASDQSVLGQRFVPPLVAGKPAMFFSDPSVPHSWTYLPDVARALVVAGTDERAWGRPWHVPTNSAMSAQAVADRIVALSGAPKARINVMPRWALDALALVVPLIRETKETRYQFDRPFVVDSSAFETTFGVAPTPMDEALKATIEWYRDGAGNPAHRAA